VINGQGGLTSAAYRFTDDEARKENYYRLKMVDRDGSFEYSMIKTVFLDCNKPSIVVYPNPVHDQQSIFIEFEDVREQVLITIFDKSGKLVRNFYHNPADGTKRSLNVADLSAGTYLINFQYEGKKETIKFVKIK